MWPFKKAFQERAAVRFGDSHMVCKVLRDADDRPYVVILGQFIRLDSDDRIERAYRDVVWITRRAETEFGSDK